MRHFPHHIGDWRPGRWIAFNPIDRFGIPSRPGVYAIYFDGELVYIGQSWNLRERFFMHKFRPAYTRGVTITPWGNTEPGVVVMAKTKLSVRYGDWAMQELRLIRRLKPRFNIKHSCKNGRQSHA